MIRPLTGWLLLVACLSLSSQAAAAPVAGPGRLLQAKEWDGIYTINRRTAQGAAGRGDKQWVHIEIAAVHLHLKWTGGDDVSGHWEGTATGNVYVDYHERQTLMRNGAGAYEASDGHQGGARIRSEAASDSVYLDIDTEAGTCSWGTDMEGFSVPAHQSGAPAEYGVPQPRPAEPARSYTSELGFGSASGGGELPAEGQTLQGSVVRHDDGTEPFFTSSEELRWTLTPVLEAIELIVEPENYAAWIPNASGSEQEDGLRPLTIRARLQKRGGGAAPRPATSIRFEMAHCSAEPGVCNNYPGTKKDRPVAGTGLFMGQGVPTTRLAAQPPQPDLQFMPRENRDLTFSDLTVCQTTDRPAGHTEATAVLSCFDWGAYGILQVTAVVPGYGEVVGHLVNDPNRLLIPIPKRSDTSLIADAWKQREGVGDLPDDDDQEDRPEALAILGGHRGDGLTLYEEYRGFYEDSEHIAGAPTRKDVFLVDVIRTPRSRDGSALFETLSRLAVHGKLLDHETESNDEINFNTSGATPRLATKYAIRLRLDPNLHAAAYGAGEVGGPKEVSLGENWDAGPDGWNRVHMGSWLVLSDLYAASVAHELLHTCSVNHHGEGDVGFEGWAEVGGQIVATPLKQGDDGRLVPTGAGRPIIVTNEAGQTLTLAQALAITGGPPVVWVGSKGGQHSGEEDCVMRYDLARAYQPARQADHRVVVPDEMTGVGLCESPAGTGANQVDRKPQPRYGDASEGRCRGQICVNDAIPH